MRNRIRYAYVTLGLFLVGLVLYGILRTSDTDVTKIISADTDLQVDKAPSTLEHSTSVIDETEFLESLDDIVQFDEEELESSLRREQMKRKKETEQDKVNAMPLGTVAEHVFTSDVDRMAWTMRSRLFSPGSTVEHLLKDPFISRLYDILENGSDVDREFVTAKLLEYSRAYVEDLPDGPLNGVGRFTASQYVPGKGMVVPFLLSIADKEGEMLEPVLDMLNQRAKSASRVRERMDGKPAPEGQVYFGDFEVISAAAIHEICTHMVDSDSLDPIFSVAISGFEKWNQEHTRDELMQGIGFLELIWAVQDE